MALPRNGFVQPVEGVAGGVPVPVSPVAAVPNTTSGSQNLGAGSLTLLSAIADSWIPLWVSLAFSAVLVGNETLTITIKNALGAAFDTVIEQVTLAPAASAALQAYIFAFPPEFALATGDEVQVTLTNSGAVETATVSAVVRGQN